MPAGPGPSPMPNASFRAWNGTTPVAGVDMLAQDLLGMRRRHLFDVHAARGAGYDDRTPGGPVDEMLR